MGEKICANFQNKLINYDNKHRRHILIIVVMRCCIVIFVFLLACWVYYLTIIVPEPTTVECNRRCQSLEWPMICRYKFIIESQTTRESTFFSINRSRPGPPITVCHNDIIVVDVENRIPELSITLHWHGQHQNETPFMDGVPMITQCPISSFTTFQYKFRASQVGTHFYYAYSGRMRNHGIIGKFIVRQPNDMSSKFYDLDTYSALITELGRHIYVDASTFLVVPQHRYRFRFIYGSAEYGYPISLKIKNHTLKVITIDGHNINPVDQDEIILNLGDRIDFVLYADQIDRIDFPIEISSTKIDRVWQGSVIYETPNNISTEEVTQQQQIRNGTHFDERLVSVNRTIYIPIVRHKMKPISQPPDNKTSTKRTETDGILGIGNLTFTFPSKPYYLLHKANKHLLRQKWPNECHNIDNHVDEHCDNIDLGNLCDCVHVDRLDVGDHVEIIFINFDKTSSYTYHLHGHSFFIVATMKYPINAATIDQIKDKNENNKLLERNFHHPPQKDTVTIDANTIVAIRFIANNPGYWMLRDLKTNSWTRGIDVILQVGETAQIIQPPNTFPKCGDWMGPAYFLV